MATMAMQENGSHNGFQTDPAKRWVGKVQVLEVRLLNSGNVRALVRVQIGASLVIRGVRVIRQPGQRAYMQVPDHWGQESSWFPAIESVDDELTAELTQVVLAAWEDAFSEAQSRAGMEDAAWLA